MPFSASVFNVLIASPSDVPQEREAIAASLTEWNALHSQDTGKVLLPVMWESHSAPTMGDRPQGIINDQIVRSCDMLIGAFWTRLGSPTGVEDSGTVEEIKWFLKNKKPVMLYFSRSDVKISQIDTKQLDKLTEFKKSIRDQGIQAEYDSVSELRRDLSRHLTIVMRGMSIDTIVTQKVVREARQSIVEPRNSTATSSSTSELPPEILKANVELIDYTDRSFCVVGDAALVSDQFSSHGGQKVSLSFGGKGWQFSKKRLDEVAKLLGIEPQLAPKPK